MVSGPVVPAHLGGPYPQVVACPHAEQRAVAGAEAGEASEVMESWGAGGLPGTQGIYPSARIMPLCLEFLA